jgi:hypothetical protein
MQAAVAAAATELLQTAAAAGRGSLTHTAAAAARRGLRLKLQRMTVAATAAVLYVKARSWLAGDQVCRQLAAFPNCRRHLRPPSSSPAIACFNRKTCLPACLPA